MTIRKFAMKLKEPMDAVFDDEKFFCHIGIACVWDVRHNNNCAKNGIARMIDQGVLQFANPHNGRRWVLNGRFFETSDNSTKPCDRRAELF